MQNFLSKLVACLLPLALTPIWVFLISEGYLNLGGGCKDVILAIPWLVGSVFYSLFFIVFWIKGLTLRWLVAYSSASAIGVLILLWIILFVSSIYSVSPG